MHDRFDLLGIKSQVVAACLFGGLLRALLASLKAASNISLARLWHPGADLSDLACH